MGRPVGQLAGRVFGRLTVLNRRLDLGKGKESVWACLCSCGNHTTARGSQLKRGTKQSCGCLMKLVGERARLAAGEAGFRMLLFRYKHNARSRCLEWALTDEEFKSLTASPCDYCGVQPLTAAKPGFDKRMSQSGIAHATYLYNGLDRIDNSVGYSLCNVVPCCQNCNFAKRDMSVQEFYAWGRRLGQKLLENV